MKDVIQEFVDASIQEFHEKREMLINQALNHFQVLTEEIPNRTKIYYLGSGVENIEIDGVRVLTFFPLRLDENDEITLAYREHYKENPHV